MAVTKWDDKVSRDMGTLVAKGARRLCVARRCRGLSCAVALPGVNSFKFFLAYKGALMVSDEEFIHGLVRCKELGALTQVHAENGDAVVLGQEKVCPHQPCSTLPRFVRPGPGSGWLGLTEGATIAGDRGRHHWTKGSRP
eukprot:scaffold1141_cov369-Prasinococcus_capsulatus_cf.AAC.8